MDSLDLARGLYDEVDHLRLTFRLFSPDGRKELALAISKFVELAGDIEKRILEVDVLDELTLEASEIALVESAPGLGKRNKLVL